MRWRTAVGLLFVVLASCGTTPTPATEVIAVGTSVEPSPIPSPIDDGLSPFVAEALRDLDTDIEVVLVLSDDSSARIASMTAAIEELTERYAARSPRLRVRAVDVPVDAAQVEGLSRRSLTIVEEGEPRGVDVFLGVFVRSEHGEVVFPMVFGVESFEPAFARAILRLRHPPSNVGVWATRVDDDEPDDLGLGELLDHVRVRPVDLEQPLDPDLDALLVVEPSRPLGEAGLEALTDHLRRGGALGVFGGSVALTVDDDQATAASGSSDLGALLRRWGVQLPSELVYDPLCARVALRTMLGPMPVPHPLVPLVDLEGNERFAWPGGEPSLPIAFTSSVRVSRPFAELGGEVWLTSSAESTSLELSESSFDIMPRRPHEWSAGEHPASRPLLVALQGELPVTSSGVHTAAGARVVVAGTGTFLRPGFRPELGARDTAHHQVAQALVDWLLGDGPPLAR